MGSFCFVEGERNVLDVEAVFNVVHKDEYVLVSVDLNESPSIKSPTQGPVCD